MSEYTIHARAFHPDGRFGMGGMYFKGDSRGFDTSLAVTSRIRAEWTLDFMTGTNTNPRPISDPSTAPWGVQENYEDERTQPEGNGVLGASPFNPEGMQTGNFQWNFRGINHAFTRWPSVNNIIVPWLDLSGTVVFSIDRDPEVQTVKFTSTLRGDGFPNSEVLVVDSNDTALMLNTHHRMGYAAGQLAYDAQHMLGGTVVTVGVNADGNFVGPVRATRCVDFMPEARDLLIDVDGWISDTYRTAYSLTEWNELHTKREATESNFLGFDTDDRLPIPRLDPFGGERPSGQNWNDWGDPFTSPGPEDLPDWDRQ